MSWLHIRVVEPPSHNERLLYRDAEVFINSASMTCVGRRQDGAIQIEMGGGRVFIAELILEYGGLPYNALRG